MVPWTWIIDSLKLSKLSDDIIRCIKKNYEKLESGTDSWRKKISWSQNPESYLPVWCAITITICDCNYSMQSYT